MTVYVFARREEKIAGGILAVRLCAAKLTAAADVDDVVAGAVAGAVW